LMCAYRDPAFDMIVGVPSAWTSNRLPDAQSLVAKYEAARGAMLNDWEFHLGLASFKIAVIAAGIDHRYRAGAASGTGFDTAASAIEPYLRLATDALKGRVARA